MSATPKRSAALRGWHFRSVLGVGLTCHLSVSCVVVGRRFRHWACLTEPIIHFNLKTQNTRALLAAQAFGWQARACWAGAPLFRRFCRPRDPVEQDRHCSGRHWHSGAGCQPPFGAEFGGRAGQSVVCRAVGSVGRPTFALGAGDVLEVSIWELRLPVFWGGLAGLRSSAATARVIVLPEQMVAAGGNIQVPLSGQSRRRAHVSRRASRHRVGPQAKPTSRRWWCAFCAHHRRGHRGG